MLALTTYSALKFLHVLSAIVAVGFNATYGIWLTRAAKDPEHESFVLRSVKVLDDRFANPAYGLLLITGLGMVLVGHLELSTFWIGGGLVLYVVAVLLGLLAYTPTLRKQIAALESGGHDAPEYRTLASRGRMLGIVVAIDVIVIVFLMVTKPTF
jgi:uncharacterized membrane protein